MNDSCEPQEGNPVTVFTVSIGGEIRYPENWTSRSAINELATLEFSLASDDAAVDLSAEITLDVTEDNDGSHRQFTGLATAGTIVDGKMRISAAGGVQMTENLLSETYALMSPHEKLSTVASLSGFADSKIDIVGWNPPPVEKFLVHFPVDGLVLTNRVHLGEVWFDSGESSNPDVREAREAFLRVDPRQVPAVASCVVSAERVLDAERTGFSIVRGAVDALLVANLYARTSKPNGSLLPFSRNRLRARPTLRPIAFVRSLESDRFWVRHTVTGWDATDCDVVELASQWATLFGCVPSQINEAASSLRLAANNLESYVDRNAALWTAIEFYASGLKSEKLFTRDEIDQMTAALSVRLR